MNLSIRDAVYFVGVVVAVAGSHFMLRAHVMVLEERLKGYSESMQRIFDTLQRIEKKLDNKVDK